MFDRLYRGEPTVEGAPPPSGIPWDVGQAQPRLMELEALGGVTGEVLDIGCGFGDNSIFLASRGYSVTALDGSATAIEHARKRASEAGVDVAFGVADATDLSGYDGRFDTVIDSALYHCLDDEGRLAYAAGPTARLGPARAGICTVSPKATSTGSIAPRAAVAVRNIRDTLTANGWRIKFLGPTTYLANTSAFGRDPTNCPNSCPHSSRRSRWSACEHRRALRHHRRAAGRQPGASAVHGRARRSGRLSVHARCSWAGATSKNLLSVT